MTSLWRLWRHLCSVEYWKLLKTVYVKIGAASSSFIWSYSNLTETFSANAAFDWKGWIWINRCFSCSDDVINIMLYFLQIQSHFSTVLEFESHHQQGNCCSYIREIFGMLLKNVPPFKCMAKCFFNNVKWPLNAKLVEWVSHGWTTAKSLSDLRHFIGRDGLRRCHAISYHNVW